MNLKLLILIILFTNILNSSIIDNYYLNRAYQYYKIEDYNSSKEYIDKINSQSLESKIALANIYYKQKKYKKAIYVYKSIKSTSIKIKQLIYYNIANSYAKISKYQNAKIYYAKVLQLGDDIDSRYNLKIIALLKDKNNNSGISKPQSQNSSSNKSNSSSKKDEKKRDNDKSSSKGNGDAQSSKKSNNKKTKLISNNKEEKHPLSSKVYELINEGYIYEKQPW